MDIATVLELKYGLDHVAVKNLYIPVNDVFEITSSQGHYAFKLYNVKSRNRENVRWEIELLEHLIEREAPVVAPVQSTRGFLEDVQLNGIDRVGALFRWAPGQKPQPSSKTYVLLGEAAAKIHAASDSFASTHPRETYDLDYLIDLQLSRLRPMLEHTGQWQKMEQLSHRLRIRLESIPLDFGVCHMDLTLDNVHVANGAITVFDLDSAALGYRANEAHGVCRFSRHYFQNWLEGYRSVRMFPESAEHAVYVFAIVGDIRGVAWKLGLAESSRGKPLMHPEELPATIDEWLHWERDYL